MSILYAGIGGSGGGGTLTGDYIPQWKEMPVASSENADYIVQYSGTTNTTYTNGYIYKCIDSSTYTSTIEFTPNKISISGNDFVNKFLADPLVKSKLHKSITEIKSGTMTYDGSTGLWEFIGKDESGEVITDPYVDYAEGIDTGYERLGFTFTGPFDDQETITFRDTVTIVSEDFAWVRTNVQPTSESGGTDNYLQLQNLPKINGTTLTGNRNLQEPLTAGANITIEDNVISATSGASSYTITAERNTQVNGYIVPELESEQVEEAYDALASGQSVMIVDASPVTNHYKVDQAINLTAGKAITITYQNIMKLIYKIDGTISYQEFGGESAGYNFGRGLVYESDFNRVSTVDTVLMNDDNTNNGLGILSTGAINSDCIGLGSSSVTDNGSIGVGFGSKAAHKSVTVGQDSQALGANSVAIGHQATVGRETSDGTIKHCIAIGDYAQAGTVASVVGAIQIGGGGQNNNSGTVQVTLTTNGTEFTSYELMTSDGKVPAPRLTNIIDDSSTGNNRTWSADKLYSVIGDVESLINAL